MFFTPASVLRLWLCGVLSLAVLAGGIYLLWRWTDELPREQIVATNNQGEPLEVRPLTTFCERLRAWRPGWNSPTAFLVAAVLLSSWSFFGRISSPWVWRRHGNDDPKTIRDGEIHCLQRPDGTQLQIECYGPVDAPLVVLTHGWSCDSTEWYYVKRHLSQRFRVVVWDLPGLGHSTEPTNRDYSLEKMAADLRAVLGEVGNRPAVLVGHSIGGMIMLTLCRDHAELLGSRVAGLVIVHSTYTNPLRTMLFSGLLTLLQKPVIEPLLHLTIWLSPLVRIMNVMSYLNGSAHWNTDWEAFAGTETRGQLDFAARFTIKTSPAVFARGCLGMLRYDATEVLTKVDVPALVVYGDRDPVTTPTANLQIDASLPNSRQFPLKPARHLGLIEHHTHFNDAVEQFLDQVGIGGPPAESSAKQPIHAQKIQS